MNSKIMCRCCEKKRANRARHLCWTCYYTPDIRAKFGPVSKYGRRSHGNFYKAGNDPAVPTNALPGTPEKVAVLEERAMLGLRLWHPDDATL